MMRIVSPLRRRNSAKQASPPEAALAVGGGTDVGAGLAAAKRRHWLAGWALFGSPPKAASLGGLAGFGRHRLAYCRGGGFVV